MSDHTSKSTSSSTSAEAAKETLKEDAEKLKERAEKEAEKLSERAEAEADEALTRAGSEIDALTGAIDAAAESLSDADRGGLAQYARQLSDQLSRLAEDLQEKSASDLAQDAQKLAKENPTGFLLGSIALGFGLSRFAKASSTRAGAEDSSKKQPESHNPEHEPAPSGEETSPAGPSSTLPTRRTP